jgi:hypothetical protein
MPTYHQLDEVPVDREAIAREIFDSETLRAAIPNSHFSCRLAERGGLWRRAVGDFRWVVLTDHRLLEIRPWGNVTAVDLDRIATVSFTGSDRTGGKLRVETTATTHTFALPWFSGADEFVRSVRAGND